jgi:hypothetical protein
MLYRVGWISKITGASGCGTGDFEIEEAQRYCTELNRQYPMLQYSPIPSAGQSTNGSEKGNYPSAIEGQGIKE